MSKLVRPLAFVLSSLLGCTLAATALGAEPERSSFSISVKGASCAARLVRPEGAVALLVLAHGQVMNVDHPFMAGVSDALAAHRVATLRFNFPYAEAGRERMDARPVLLEAFAAAVRAGEQRRGALPLFVGGKSVGGMIAAEAVTGGALPPVGGVVVLGYPLHAPGRPGGVNAAKLRGLSAPLLVIQGTRDPLADITLMTALVESLGPRARLVRVDGGDHSFALPEGSGRSAAEVFDQLASAVEDFVASLVAKPGG